MSANRFTGLSHDRQAALATLVMVSSKQTMVVTRRTRVAVAALVTSAVLTRPFGPDRPPAGPGLGDLPRSTRPIFIHLPDGFRHAGTRDERRPRRSDRGWTSFHGLDGLGGEAVLTRGPVVLDLQALGGLYDPIALEVVPEALRAEIEAGRPVATPATFCQILGDADHVAAAPGLPASLRDAARQLDRMRNIDPQVARCQVDGQVATFHKEATFESAATSARQNIFGAIRFLDPPFSAFHIVRARRAAPTSADIDALERIVRTLKLGPGGG